MTENKNKNIEKLDIGGSITGGFDKAGSSITGGFDKAGSSITGGFNDVGNFFKGDFVDFFTGIGDFFKNIFGDFSKYLNMLSWICFVIICLCCCSLFSPIIMPMLSLSSLGSGSGSNDIQSLNF
jgi:hypothetical protein